MPSSVLQRQHLIIPDWPAPSHVKAFFTTRAGGVSTDAYTTLNLGAHVGDAPEDVAENRHRLRALLPSAPVWLNQVHGSNVFLADQIALATHGAVEADASVTTLINVPCAVLVADCMPVLFCSADGSCVGVAHAGWRGINRGVLEATVAALNVSPANIIAWLGPAIGPDAFEVGEDVFDAFTTASSEDASAFQPIAGQRGKYLADIYELARRRLRRAGVQAIFGGKFCTVGDPARFFSYRRDGKTGRMAAMIWRE